MQVFTVTSRIRSVPGNVSVLPSCSNFTASALGRIVATANVACASPTRTKNALANTARPRHHLALRIPHIAVNIIRILLKPKSSARATPLHTAKQNNPFRATKDIPKTCSQTSGK